MTDGRIDTVDVTAIVGATGATGKSPVVGDRIIAIDGTAVRGRPVAGLDAMLGRGPKAASRVTLEIERPGPSRDIVTLEA